MRAPQRQNSPRDRRGHGPSPHVDGGVEALFPAARRVLPPELNDAFRILGDYAGALRAIADHPALDPPRKEARLKAVARAVEGAAETDGEDAAVRAALNLRHLLESRSLGIQDSWQMLQAAGQDIHKLIYPDWSDLLAWSRYWAAPLGRMAFSLAGGSPQELAKAESLAIAVQLLHLVEQAPTQHRWLGRVYLPARWFREAGSDASELAGAGATEGLRRVFDRTIDEAEALISANAGLHRDLPSRRLQIAGAIALGEARAWARVLRKTDPLKGTLRPGGAARLAASVLGVLRGIAS